MNLNIIHSLKISCSKSNGYGLCLSDEMKESIYEVEVLTGQVLLPIATVTVTMLASWTCEL
jgi:hypothetical protein